MPSDAGLPISNGRQGKGEIWKVIQKLKNRKAAGPDNIPIEALKADKNSTVYPTRRERRNHNQAQKKELSNCSNYRGITLLFIPGKVLNKVILERMKDAVDPQRRDEQAGFRSNTDHV